MRSEEDIDDTYEYDGAIQTCRNMLIVDVEEYAVKEKMTGLRSRT